MSVPIVTVSRQAFTVRPAEAAAQGASHRSRRGINEHLVSLLAPTSFEAEQYRHLCHFLEHRPWASDRNILAVSGPGVGDGKTTTAINLAGTLVQAPGARVLLVDTDLRRPSVAAQLGMEDPARPGLADLLLDPALGLQDVVRTSRPFNLSVLAAGRCPADPYRVLCAPRFGELLWAARQSFDWIVLDTPPVLAVPDCRVVARWVDGFLIVVAAHRTPRKLLEETLTVLEPEKVIGIVFNGDERPLGGYHKYYQAYGYARRRGGAVDPARR